MMHRKQLPRRTFLKGVGAAVALPLMDAMIPAFALPGSRPKVPCRMLIVYVPNGIDMRYWTPSTGGSKYELTRLLEPLAAYREDMLVMSGLTHNNGRALGDGPGDHARAAASFLTGVHPKKTAGADIKNGISVDQVAAGKIGKETRLPSLELGCEDGRQVGSCDSGYSCAYSYSISWSSETTPLPPEVNPRLAFERLFGSSEPGEGPAARAKRNRYNRSILDYVLDDTHQLQGVLGPTDRRKLDEYLTAVREIEQRIEAAERNPKEVAPSIEKPAGIPIEFAEHVRLMFDLMVIAVQADLTRVVTFMVGREGSTRTYRDIGISEAHHPLTHHRNDPEMMEKVARINRYHVEHFAYFLGRMKAIAEGEGRLLDNSMVIYGSGLSDGNKHWHHDLPVLLVGRGAGTVHPGRYLRYPKDTPMSNLFLSMLDRMGVPAETLGDSNSQLQELSLT